MKSRSIAWAAALFVAAAPACAQEKESVTMAVPALSLSFSLGYLAEDLGFFAADGIAVKQLDIAGLGAINSLIAGSTDFAEASGASLTRAAARGQRLLAIAEMLDRPFVQIILRKTLADQAGFDPASPLAKRALVLKGRTIGVDSVNAVNHAYLRLVARAGGYDPESVPIAVMAPPSLIAGFETKQIDGYRHDPALAGEAAPRRQRGADRERTRRRSRRLGAACQHRAADARGGVREA